MVTPFERVRPARIGISCAEVVPGFQARSCGFFPNKKRTRFHKHCRADRRRLLQAHVMTAQTLESQSVPGRRERRPLRLKKILVPIDFSPPSKNALKYAVRFAEEFGGELTLLYVLEPQSMTGLMAIPEAT